MNNENRPFPDFNNNGIPDYQEGWFYQALWFGVRIVAAIVPQHTLFARGVGKAEEFRAGM